MHGKVCRVLFFILFALVLYTPVAPAQDGQTPLDAGLRGAVYLSVPDAPSSINGKGDISLYLGYDRDQCRKTYGDNADRACGRPLGRDGKRIEAGVSIDPPTAGEWRWIGESGVGFTPSQYWRAGQAYTIAIDLDALGVTPVAEFTGVGRKTTLAFAADNLAVAFPDVKYLQDPEDVNRRVVSARLELNYPVEPAALTANIRLETEEESGGTLATADLLEPFEITHDASGMAAIMAVPIKSLPDTDKYLRIKVLAGLTPKFGGADSVEDFSQRARIPNLNSYLEIENAEASIMRGDNGTPAQILSFATNVKAKPQELLPNISLKLLPARHPVSRNANSDGADQALYQWEAENEVTPEILALSETITPEPMRDGGDYATQFGFPVKTPPGRYLYLEIAARTQAFGGYTLGRPFRKILRMPEWPHDIAIMQDGSILTLSGAKKLSLRARGTDALKVEVAHIRTQALQHFISQTYGDIRSPSFSDWSFNPEDIAQIDTSDLPMNFESPEAAQYAALDFAPYLEGGRKGLFLIGIQGFHGGEFVGAAEQRFVLVTDMGLLVKENADKRREVFLASFSRGGPVSGADVSVLGRNGLSIFEGKTDADGHVELPVFTGYARDREPVAITARIGEDYTFIPFEREDRKLNLSKYDIGGNVVPPEGLSALLFTDRGIYRPGETVHIGAVTRSTDWAALPPELPLRMKITDPLGRVALEKVLKFPSSGLQELSFETREISLSGQYFANLFIGDDADAGSLLGSARFRVEDYQPDRLRIKAEFPLETKGWFKPEGLKARVTLANLYGAPATDRRITGKVTLKPAALKFEGFEDYGFYDSYPAKNRTIQYDLNAAKTDGAGAADLDLDLESQERASFGLGLQAQGFEAGSGRGVSAYTTARISPMEYAVGFRADANLNYLRKGEDYALSLLAVGPTLERVAADDLTLELVERSFVSTLVKREDGAYAYEATPREKLVSTEAFAIPAAGASLPLPAREAGLFAYHVKDHDGRVVADIPFAVAGEGRSAAGKDKEAVLDLRIDKTEYGPGETIELSIDAPYTGSGLITLESDRVLAYRWFRADKTQSVQSIAIPPEFSGKGYVSVSFVRDLNSPEIYMSPLSTAVAPFTANMQARTMRLSITAPEQVKPGEPVTVAYKGNMPGKAIIYAIDTGILQVARYRTPDPVAYFLTDRALQVSTSQMLDLLMPEFDLMRSLSAQGGDAEAQVAAFGKHVNPFRRRTLAPAVYWSGVVDVGTEEKTLSFTPPGYFNGEMTIMAVAVSESGVGNFKQALTVQGDLIVTPNAPLFLAPGDSAVLSVTVANTTDEAGDLILGVAGSEGLTLDAGEKALKLGAHEEQTASFTLSAGDALGEATLSFTARLGDLNQSAQASLSIRPPVAKETSMVSGYAEHGSGQVALGRDLYPEFARKEAALSAIPTPYIYSLKRYIDGFPYGCSEQITSKAAPLIALLGLPEFNHDAEAMKATIADTVATLRQRQTYEGGFSYWSGAEQADAFVSVYALDFLTQAREANLPVPDETTRDALRYVRSFVNNDIDDASDARTKAYGVYVLTRNGIVTSNEILHLLKWFEDRQDAQWKTDLTAVYVAAAYRLMQQSALAEKTLAEFEAGIDLQDVSYAGQDWSEYWYNPLIKYARYVTLLSRHFPERMAALDQKIIFTIAAFVNDQRYNTVSSAYVIAALKDYAAAREATISAANFTVSADGRTLGAAGLSAVYTAPPDARSLRFEGQDTPLFYTVSETGYDRAPSAQPVAMNMEISREYFTETGEKVEGSVAIGDVVEARVSVRSHDGRILRNVAIVDLLPGGFDLERGESGDTGGMDAVDRREDRIVAFGPVTPDEGVFTYRLRAASKGTFVVPAPYAEAMYDLTTKAKGRAGSITITDPK